MKIKRAPKRAPSTNASVASFVVSLNTAPNEELTAILGTVLNVGWSWPRTDLQHWINPLNRFDSILEEVINDYDLGSMEHTQRNDFTPRTKELVASILAFEKVLLENSTNRKIFNSFDRLNDLLHTSDLSILLATLRLALRPAQQFSSSNQNGVVVFGMSEKRLLNLAQGWGLRDYGLEMVDLAAENIEVPPELDDLEWQFYKKAAGKAASGEPATEKKAKGKEVDTMDVEDTPTAPNTPGVPSASTSATTPHLTPGPRAPSSFFPFPGGTPVTPANPPPTASTSNEGLATVVLSNLRTSTTPSTHILVDAVEEFGVPESDRLALLQKIRIHKSLGNTEDRRAMLLVRLLALAIFAHTTGESNIQTKLFLYEPELIPQLAELVHPDRTVSVDLQAAALYALDGIAKFKSKTLEVASALNASVSHGIIMYVLRRTVTDLDTDNPITTVEFVDALFNILSFFQTSSHVGNMLIGAGITTTLVDFVKIQRRDRIGTVTRAITFLDSLMYGYSSAFNFFISIGGLPVFVERVKDEVELCVAAHQEVAATISIPGQNDAPTGLLSFDQAALLKGLLRAIQRLMQTAGTTEGLRNLIDTSLLSSVKTIISNREIFGPQLFGLSINITATFVHNEPTCLATIQEAKVPAALYDAVEEHIPSFVDVLQAIPNAIGALCLNAAGLAEFNTRSIIPKFFGIFSSEKHVQVLQERDNANLVGQCIDELVRHHPSLKDTVLGSIVDAIKSLRDNGKAFVPESSVGYTLQVEEANSEAPVEEAKMETSDQPPAANLGPASNDLSQPVGAEPGTPKTEELKDNTVLVSVDVMCRFLEGLFQNVQHCKDFIRLDPFPVMLELLTLPCVPSSMINTAAFTSLSTLFRVMSEVKPTEVVQAVLTQLKSALAISKPTWGSGSTESQLLPLLNPTTDTLAENNKQFREITTLLNFIALLLDMCHSLVYSHGKVATLVLAALAASDEVQTILDLGQVHRFASWENIHLKKATAQISPTPPSEATSADATPLAADAAASSSTDSPSAVASTDATVDSAVKEPSKPAPPNVKAVQEVVTNLPLNIAPLLQAATKMFVHRRSGETAHRKASSDLATSIATVMAESCKWPDSVSLTDNLAYSTAMISFVTSLLYDERSSTMGIQTMLLVAFGKAGGLADFLGLYSRYQDVANDLVAKSDDKTKLEFSLPVVHAFGGLKTALDLLLRLSSHKTLLEAPQTALLLQREKDKSSPDFFQPHEFLINVRATILPAVARTWEVSWLSKSPPNIVRNVVGILVNILRAEGETASEATTPDGSNRPFAPFLPGLGGGPLGFRDLLAGAGGGAAGPPTPTVANEAFVTQLVEMGFPRSAVRTALVRCRNSVPVATEYLLQHPGLVAEARDAEAHGQQDGASGVETPAEPAVVDPTPADPAPAPVDANSGEAETPIVVDNEEANAAPEVDVPVVAAEEATPPDIAMNGAGEGDASSSTQSNEAPVDSPRALVTKAAKEKLDKSRGELKAGFLAKALRLAEDFPELVFDIKGAFSLLYQNGDDKAPSLTPLLEDLAKVEGEGATEQAIATRLRVIALLSADAAFRDTLETSRVAVMEVLMRYQQKYMALSPEKDARPKWLPPTTLVADALFSLAEVPRTVTILSDSEEPELVDLACQGPSWDAERHAFFDLAMHLLTKGISDRESFISCLRLLLVLTRQHDLAAKFVELDGLRHLFAALAVERPETENCHTFAVMILRHVIEDLAMLRPMMVREIEAWFQQPRAKVADVSGFLRGISSVAFRNVPLFLEAVKSTCKLVKPDTSGHYHIAQKVAAPAGGKTVETAAESSAAQGDLLAPPAGGSTKTESAESAPVPKSPPVSSTPSLAPTPSADAAVHFLMAEAYECGKAVLATPPETSPPIASEAVLGSSPSAAASGGLATASTVAPHLPDPSSSTDATTTTESSLQANSYVQLSFSLSCLGELLSSYSTCKTSFLSFSTRKTSKESAKDATALRSRSSFLYFLLNDVIPLGSIVPVSNADGKKRGNLAMWATLVIVSLCSDPDAAGSKDSAHDITAVRKGVLDAIARAFKEATTSNEPTDIRYGRLYALSDVCFRLLTSKPYATMTKPNDETSMQIAKLMLEKNFAVILTNALADVDLNFPMVNNLINSILRPLEQLTKVVTKVGRAKSSTPAPRRDGHESSSDDSLSEGDLDAADSEEDHAPDLYRNSALGMYEGELEPGNQDDVYMSGDSEGEFDDEDEMLEEMDDGLVPGSDLSDVSDEDEPAFMDEDDIEMEHDMDDSDSEGDTDDDDDHSDDTDGSEGGEGGFGDGDELEIAELEEQLRVAEAEDEEPWEDLDGDEDQDGGDDGDPGADMFENPPLRDDEDDESDAGSFAEEEEMFLTGELEFEEQEMVDQAAGRPQAPFGWDQIGSGEGLPSGRRSRLLDDMMMGGGDSGIFGSRARAPAAPPTPAHPLLVDSPAGDQQLNGGSSRRHRRGIGSQGAEYASWAQSIERMMGAGAVDALQDLLASHGLPNMVNNEQVRLSVGPGPDGSLALIVGTNQGPSGGMPPAPGHARRGLGAGALPTPSVPQPRGRSTTQRSPTAHFHPIMTVQRWQEEGRVEQGSVLPAERTARLTNHVINVLHPDARSAAKVAEAERTARGALRQRLEQEAANAKRTREVEEAARAGDTTHDTTASNTNTASMEVEDSSTDSETSTAEEVSNAPVADIAMDDMAAVLALANSLASGLGAPGPSSTTPAVQEPVADAQSLVASSSAPTLGDMEITGAEGSGSGVTGGDDVASGNDDSSASEAGARVIVTIDDQEYDITDTGIDPTFLEALPDDMRQEVLNQHFRESRSSAAAPPAAAVPSQIESEFLDALPPDLRAEVLRQEAREQASARAAAARASGEALDDTPAGPVDIDPATFFASLDPELRDAVLLDQEDSLLDGLPANLAAEARVLRAQDGRRAHRVPNGNERASGGEAPASGLLKRPPTHREAIQLLDKSGLATLVRLLFVPQPLRKNVLQKVLVNLCENSRTRSELINLLLTILQDGTRDVSAVDKSFSQMSLRASKSLAAKDTPRRKVGLETPGGALPHFPGESVPNLIAQRCLEALMFLVGSNDQSPLFFLTEQDIVMGLSKRQSKKGKGKEKALPSKTFPIVVLLGLLDRPALVKTQSMMDSLTQLLSTITKTLSVLASPSTPVVAPLTEQSGQQAAPTPADVALASAASQPAAHPTSGASDLPADGVENKEAEGAKEALTSDALVQNPPQIAPAILRLVVNVLDAGECSSKTFQQTLVLIQNLSYLPGARDIILEELKARAQSLSDQLLPDLSELHEAIIAALDVRSVTLAKFSPASSLQAKFLRVLKTIDYSPPKKTAPDVATPTGGKKLSEEEEKVRDIYDSFSFGKLWERLGSCLTAVEEKADLSYIGNVLLPLIEAVMVVSKFVGRRPPKDVQSPSDAPMSPSAHRDTDPQSIEGMFLRFTDDHRRTINQLVRSNPGLMSGSFAVLAKNSSILDFDTKRNFFFSRLHDRSLRQRNHYGTLQINVRRAHVFEDSYHALQRRTGDEIKHGKLNVKFYEEEGVDAGGVTREWFSVLARQMFNPGYALFQPQAADSLTYQPNKSSSVNEQHLNYFKFVGRIIGKALHDQRVLEAYFSRSVYKHMLGKPVDHRDLESIDPEYHKSLVWMLENDIDGILDLTFSIERDEFGVSEIVDLIPNGRNVPVTNENKAEYVRLIADQRLSIEIKDQMQAMLNGLYEIVPKDLLEIFSEKELELLISGLPEIDVDEWRANTDLHNFTPTHPVIGYFWRAVRSFTMEERAKLLQFVSGSSRVPLEGFAHLQGMSGVTKFSITSAGDRVALPAAHTCFNQLDLSSNYTSYEELRAALLLAMTEGGEGFGFA